MNGVGKDIYPDSEKGRLGGTREKARMKKKNNHDYGEGTCIE